MPRLQFGFVLCILWCFLSLLSAHPGRAQVPAWQWATIPGGPTDSTMIFGAATDAAGNVYVAGLHGGGAAIFGGTTLQSDGADAFVAKLSPAGQWLWAVPVAATGRLGEGRIALFGISVDAVGNVYVGGTYEDTLQLGTTTLLPILFNPPTINVSENAFVASLDPQGHWRWATAANPGTTGRAAINALATDAAGHTYVTGAYNTTVTLGPTTLTTTSSSEQGFVARLSEQGQWEWAVAIDASVDAQGTAIGVMGTQGVAVAGNFIGALTLGANAFTTGFNFDDALFVGQLSPTGQWQWSQAGIAQPDGGMIPCSVAADSSGRIFVGGGYYGEVRFGGLDLGNNSPFNSSEACIVAASAQGWEWVKSAHTSGGIDLVWGMVTDNRGQLLVSGSIYAQQTQFDSATVVTGGCFVAAFDGATGTGQWALNGGGAAASPSALVMSPAGDLYMAGLLTDSTTFGSVTVRAPHGAHALVARISRPLGVAAPAAARTFSLFPNPAHHTVRLTGAASGPVQVLDALGRVVRTAQAAPETALDLRGLPPGLYTVRAGSVARRLVVE